MAVTNFTPLLGLALPTTGDLSGTWGTTVNDAITDLLDDAVAGTVTLSADADVTLTTTNGANNQARNAVILWTASNGATTRNITAPAQSKAYIVINAGTGSVVIRGSGPTAGVTVASGYKVLVAWNGSDFVKVASSVVNLASEVTGTLPIANGGTGTTSTTFANLATNVTGILPIANGGTATATPALVQGSGVTITGTWPNQTIAATGSGGTVTTVGFTGGIVTVANPTTTPAFTIAGTSGGIPYFASGSTWASSAALTQYGVVYGGGAGATPVATAAGTTGQILTATTGGAPSWATNTAASTGKAIAMAMIFGF